MKMKFLDRDLSELSFYRRVLDQVNSNIPLGEKLFFIGVTFSNMSEYAMSRYPRKVSYEDREKVMSKLRQDLSEIYIEAGNAFEKINLKKKVVETNMAKSGKRSTKLKKIFKEDIYPTIQPKMINSDSNIDLKSNELCIIVKTSDENDDTAYHLIAIPYKMNRFVELKKQKELYFIEDLIISNLDYIFRGYKVLDSATLCVQRSFNLQFDDGDDMLSIVKKSLKKINNAWITRIELGNASPKMTKFIKNHLIHTDDTILVQAKRVRLMDLKDYPKSYLNDKDMPRKFKSHNTFNKNTTVFDIISEESKLVYHPYESFDDSVLRFIKEAAKDPNVVSIKMTLYRVAKKSKVIKYLMEAADRGKSVTVLVELKARFNEVDNINISLAMKEAGIDIIYTDEHIKTHAKMCIVTREEKKGLRIYSHVGTGNYSEVNSKSYTDYSYFTKDKTIGKELTDFFNVITGSSKKVDATTFLHAPKTLRSNIISLIKEQKSKKDKGYIFMKCNGLTDEDIAKELYLAAEAGCKVTLFVRGACIVKPNQKGTKKNIKIYSMVGQYLEHSRVYIFGEKNPKIYIGSSDMMNRNLSNRNELLLNITDKKSVSKILKHVGYLLKDDSNKYIMKDNYRFEKATKGKFNMHKKFNQDAKKEKDQ